MMTLIRIFALFPLLGSAIPASPKLEIRFDSLPKTGEDKLAPNWMGDASTFPSSNWSSQAQPIGNGRLGAMVFGNPLTERIQFNDITLWTGGDNPSGGYKYEEFGSYQNFGDLRLEMQTKGEISDFSRTLDLATGIHTTTWKQGGVRYQREISA